MSIWITTFEDDKLATTGGANLLGIDQSELDVTDQAEMDAASASKYLPRLQLMTSNSKECKAGKFAINHFALVSSGGSMLDLGDSVDVIVVARRPKGMDLTEGMAITYRPLKVDADGKILEDENGDPIPNPVWVKIQEASEVKGDQGHMYGVEFLIWIPGQKCFATQFCGNKSTRRETDFIGSRLGDMITYGHRMVETKEWTYETISTAQCSTPPSVTPDPAAVREELGKFQNAKDTTAEQATDEEAAATSRER